MFHSVYPTPWVLGNNVQLKFPYFLALNDLHLLTIEPVTAVTPYTCLTPVYTSPIAFDAPNMKRVPVNWLMQNFETVNCHMSVARRKDFKWSPPARHFSKESSLDLSQGSDSCMVSSRSSTPSSLGTVASEEEKIAVASNKSPSANRRERKYSSSSGSSYVNSVYQKYSPFNQRNSPNVKSLGQANYKNNSPHISVKNHMDDLSLEIWKHYVKNRQPEEMFFKKMNLKDEVHRMLSQIFPNCGLCIVGSSVNGLGTNTSDMDVCLMLTTLEIDQQTEAMQLLRHAQRLLNRCSFIKTTELITAKVPILKFSDKYDDIQVDLNVNNTVGIANTQLIRNYCCLDWRVQPLMLAIKKWAQDCDINNAKAMTLSSYSLVLMVIHYLQCGCHPCVLPCLQKMRLRNSENYVKFGDPFLNLPNFKSRNNSTLGELFIGFFDYFSNHFDFEKDVISIRLGSKVSKLTAMNFRSSKNKRGHWKYICIEEPFNRTNTACAVYDAQSFSRILNAFRSTWIKIKSNKQISAALRMSCSLS